MIPLEFFEKKSLDFSSAILVLLIGTCMGIFVLGLLEASLFPYPVFLEELLKALLIFFVICRLETAWQKIGAGVFLGILFGLGENILYLPDAIGMGDIWYFFERCLYVAPMHLATVLLMVLVSIKYKPLIVIGFIGALLIHTYFNQAFFFSF